MNSLQSITQKDLDNGLDYISVMEKNLEVLKQAL
jgi:zinc transport system substrate-binding protein